MARRTRTTESNPATEESTVTTTTEAPVETPVPAAEAPAEAKDKKDKKDEVKFDLTAFQSAAQTAVSEADQSTGEIAPAVVEPVVKEYRTIEGLKGKNAAKAWLTEQMKAAMVDRDIVKARSWLQLSESMTAGSAGGTPKAPADPTQTFVQAEATLRLAQELHVPGEGVSEDAESKVTELVESSREQAEAYLAWFKSTAEDKGDEPEVTAVVKNAVKLALGKAAKAGARVGGSGGTYTGERRDIGKHIAAAFEGVESGTFLTVAEIRNHKSDEYGDNPPSAGAISARLFPSSGKSTVEGVEPGTNDKGKKGATKL